MNSKSQLEWFYTLPNIVKTHSGSPKIKWLVANRAKANIIRISKQQEHEAAIARVLYAELQKAEQGQIIIANWTAFLSRHSEKAAYKVRGMLVEAGLASSQELTTVFEEILLIGIALAAEPNLFLTNFTCDRATDDLWYGKLHGYCSEKMRGKLIDRVRARAGNKSFKRSNLGLAARASKTRVTESLVLIGIQNTELEQYLYVWQCFIEVKDAYGIDTKSPQESDFQLIAERMHELEVKHKYNLFPLAVANSKVKAYLEQTGKAIRYLIDRPILSIDKSVSPQDSAPLSDLIPDLSAKNDLESAEQSSRMDTVTAHTYDYLQQIDSSKWLVWFLKELVDLKQTDVATIIGSTQKTVSLRYRKVWQNFLAEIISKFQPANSASQELSSETITDLKEGLAEIVKSYFRSSLQDYLQSSVGGSDRATSQQLVEFLQNRSNQKLTVNPDIRQKLDSFMETIE